MGPSVGLDVWRIQQQKIPRSAHTVNLCLYESQNKQRSFPYTALTDRFLGAVAKLRRATISFVMSVRPSVRLPHGTIWLSLERFSLNFIFEHFSKN